MIVLFSLLIWLLGLTFMKITKMSENHEGILILSMPTGFVISSLLTNVMYIRLGISLNIARVIFLVLMIVCVGYLIHSRAFSKKVFYEYAAIMVVFAVISIPGLVRGEQYYVYRGNVWDQFIYYSEIVYASMYKIGADLTNLAYTSDAILEGYNQIVTDRPTAPLMCALLCPQGYSTIFKQAFLYHMLMMSTVVCSMTYLIRKITNKKVVVSFVAALIYVIGFYGQIQYDINAWSQVVAMSGLIAYVCVVMTMVYKDVRGENAKIGDAIYLLICGVGLLLLYPENMIIHGALIVVASIIVYLISWKLPSKKLLLIAFIVPALALLLCVFLDMNTIRFAIGQINSAYSEVRQSWATYFDAYWLGYHGVYADTETMYKFKCIISLLPCWCGMFIITPDYGLKNLLLVRGWMLFMMLLSLGIITLLIRSFGVLVPNKANSKNVEKDRVCFRYLSCMVLMGIIMFASMFSKKEYWSAGKLLLYVSQYLYVLLIFPFITAIGNKEVLHLKDEKMSLIKFINVFFNTVTICVSIIFLTTQIAFSGMRIYDAVTNENCTGYGGNYPSDQYPDMKENFKFDYNAKQYDKGELVTIDGIEEPFYQDYIKVALSYEKIRYIATPNSRFRYGEMMEE